jgi:hypothetical protein
MTPPSESTLGYVPGQGMRRQPAPGESIILVPMRVAKGAFGFVTGVMLLPFAFAGLCFTANKWPWEIGR